MSTMRPRPRLLALQVGPFGLGLGLLACLSLAGCASTSDLRSGGASKTKTALAIGDKPLPVVGGEPGSSVATEDDEPTITPPSKRAEGRISGRVYDADGRPVPNAQVRLAVGSAAGGKVVRAATDPSGGFTLHGLRPGTSYTLIAESPSSDGVQVQSGRARATASQTNVRISLASGGASAADGRAAEAPSVNVNRVSDRAADAADESSEPENPGAGSRRVNEEDLPPATEAEAVAPGRSPARGGTADARWQRGQAVASSAGEAAAESDASVALPSRRSAAATEPAPVDPEARGTASSRPAAPSNAPDDEGPNPLPPALESGQSPSASTALPIGAGLAAGPVEADPFADQSPRIASSGRERSARRSLSTGTTSPYDSPSHPTRSAPMRRAPADDAPPPGALVVTPETFGPVVFSDDPFQEPVTRTASTAAPARTPRTRPRSTTAPAPAPAPVTTPLRPEAQSRTPAAAEAAAVTASLPPVREAAPARAPNAPSALAMATAAATAAAATRPRPTWGDVANSGTSLPPLEGESDAKTKTPAVARRDPPVRGASATVEARDATAPSCDYDDRHRRVLDFRLPGLDGKPVRFADLDADLILLDFWGTWCQPCIRSVPHLVDLQAKATGKRLKVVGIACEPDPPDVSARKVAASVKKLGINYPVLLSRNDGTCPLQEALHVQALPTMVLLDRQGRVLWRDQGATAANLARLDHMIATATGDGTVRR